MREPARRSARRLLGLVVLVVVVAAAVAAASSRGRPAAGTDATAAASPPLHSTFFGMNTMAAGSGAWPAVPVGAARLWDSQTSWKHVNPAPGTWSWQTLDVAVATAEAHRVPVLLVLGQTPGWVASRPAERAYYDAGAASMPRDLAAWAAYVRAVAERYRGRIEAYEVWNEANLPGFFSGSPEQMVELTRVARQAIAAADPHALVVGPSVIDRHDSAVAWMRRYLAAGGGALVDVIAVHLYPAETKGPEAKPLLSTVRALLRERGISRPVWDTEANYQFNGHILDHATAVAFVTRTYLWSAGEDLARVYWYAWEMQHPAVAIRMTAPDLTTPTAAARAFATVQSWIRGWRPQGCSVDASGSWTCRFARGAQRRAAVWNPVGTTSVPAPAWARAHIRLGASSAPLSVGQRVPVDGSPVLFTSE